MADDYTLDEDAFRRTREAVLKIEGQVDDLRTPSGRKPAGVVAARFKLTAPAEVGKLTTGQRLQMLPAGKAGEFRWVPSGADEILYTPGCGQSNFLAEGSEVTAVPLGDTWCIISYELWAMWPDGVDPFQYAVCRISERYTATFRNSYKLALTLKRPLTYEGQEVVLNPAPWEDSYAFVTAYAPASREDSPEQASKKSEDRRLRMVPITTQMPARITYEPFKGIIASGQKAPAPVVQALKLAEHPSAGELWSPGKSCKLQRAMQILPIYWWEWCAPQWTCRTFETPNPEWRKNKYAEVTFFTLEEVIQRSLGDPPEEMSEDMEHWWEVRVGNVTTDYHANVALINQYLSDWPERTEFPRWGGVVKSVTYSGSGDERYIDKDYWAIPQQCVEPPEAEGWSNSMARAAEDAALNTHSGVECSDDPPARGAVIFRASRGFWQKSGAIADVMAQGRRGVRVVVTDDSIDDWGIPGWDRSGDLGSVGTGLVSTTEINSLIPTDLMLKELEESVPRDPPCGHITRRKIYGYVVWEYGWRIADVDKNSKTCIVADREFSVRRRLVISGQEPPAFVCQ